jgi:hypothetical protein
MQFPPNTGEIKPVGLKRAGKVVRMKGNEKYSVSKLSKETDHTRDTEDDWRIILNLSEVRRGNRVRVSARGGIFFKILNFSIQ